MRRFFGLLLISMLLTSFQCQQWTKYSKDINAKVDPETIILNNDTVSFVVTINYNHERFKDEKTNLTLYALGEEQWEELSQIELMPGLTTKSIKQNLNSKYRIKNIGVKFKNESRPSTESPILPIAFVQDKR